MIKKNNFIEGEEKNCLNYPDGCWTCVYNEIYGQFRCSRPNQSRTLTFSTTYVGGKNDE